jgi:N-acetylneuraminic acid mutarotase
MNTCEYYDIQTDKWHNSPFLNQKGTTEFRLHKERSQGAACVFEEDVGFVFGGYHKDEGTINSIERFDFNRKRLEKMDLIIPQPIRRFGAIKISTTKILLIGGLTKTS